MDIKKFETTIRKTGFELEFNVSECLRKHKWTVINNKYYVDDVALTVREIDLIAYKINIVESIYVYTVLIVSCKKNEENIWGLLSKDKNINDPNTDWYPVSAWSNNEVLKYMLSNYNWKDGYLSLCKDYDIHADLIEPEHHIFAFQEMNKANGSPKNDKNIFASISSLMKAEGYELSSLSKRKKEDCLYNFNLISVADTELVKLHFGEESVDASLVDNDKYIGSYIVNNNDVQSRIHFINSEKINDVISSYDKLHQMNRVYFKGLVSNFYKDAVKNIDKTEVFKKPFLKSIIFKVNRVLKTYHNTLVDEDDFNLFWNKDKGSLEIDLSLGIQFPSESEDAAIEKLNSDKSLNEGVRKSLLKYYRYSGDYIFSNDYIPF